MSVHMDSSSSCDECSKAPATFHVSTTSDEEDDHPARRHAAFYGGDKTQQQNATRCCPLCRTQQHRFHCHRCVKSGNIIHSDKGNILAFQMQKQPPLLTYHETLNEKQLMYLSTQRSLKVVAQRYEQLQATQRAEESKQFAIKRKREQLALLQRLIAEKRKRLQMLGEHRDEKQRANEDKRKNLPNYPIKVNELCDHVFDRSEKNAKLSEHNHLLLDQLQNITQRSVRQLITYIFPITECSHIEELRKRIAKAVAALMARNAHDPNFDGKMAVALVNAKYNSLPRGKWGVPGGVCEIEYRIVGPTLPDNGDYGAYLEYMLETADAVPKTTPSEVFPTTVDAFRILGGLTLTTQLMQLLSYQLNVRLPHKLSHGDFCKRLNEEQFLRKVSRLNSNVMYLAYTQQVKLAALNEQHTLANIVAILDLNKSKLGRHGYQEVSNAPLIKSVDSLLVGIDTDSESEDDNSLRTEWEAVPDPIDSILTPPVAQQSTISEGLITSAANRITSLLRWIK